LAEEFFSGESARPGVRTIFAVGDEKQSIYRFQGADPAIFARMEAHFGGLLEGVGGALHTPVMHLTHRSVKPILQLVDQVFSDPERMRALSGAEIPQTHDAAREGQAGLVELWPTEKPIPIENPLPWNVPLDFEHPQSPRTRLAAKIADLVGRWIKDGEV